MNAGITLELWQRALETMVAVGGPFVLSALAVGLLMSIVQAATQLQENILSFAPKLLAIGLVLALGGTLLMAELINYFTEIARAIESLGGRRP